MNAIIELVKIAKPNKQLLGGKMLALIEGIESGAITSKEDAIQKLLKDNATPQRSIYYLIHRTKKALIKSVISSIKGVTENQRAYYEAYGGFTTAMYLFTKSSKAAAHEAKKVLQVARKYEFIHIASALTMKLTKYHAEVEPNRAAQKRYANESHHYADLIQSSTIANSLYSKAIIAISNRSSYSKGTKNLLQSICTELSGKRMTVEATSQYYMLRTTLCFANQDYPAGALICSQVLKKYSDHPAFQKGFRQLFLSYQSIAAIAAGQHEKAELILLDALEHVGFVTNWQIFMYYRAINALHFKRYFKAQHIRDEAAKRQQSGIIKEYWAIISAYIYFFNGGKFRLGKFFNETIEASQDKPGLNVDIIIADLLISLTDNRDRFLHRIESVRTYAYRHLKGKANERVRLFLDLLFQIPRNDFDVRRIERATGHVERKLRRRSVYANHNLEIEIVPWEDLWGRVLEGLGEKEMVKGVR